MDCKKSQSLNLKKVNYQEIWWYIILRNINHIIIKISGIVEHWNINHHNSNCWPLYKCISRWLSYFWKYWDYMYNLMGLNNCTSNLVKNYVRDINTRNNHKEMSNGNRPYAMQWYKRNQKCVKKRVWSFLC